MWTAFPGGRVSPGTGRSVKGITDLNRVRAASVGTDDPGAENTTEPTPRRQV
ncbi:hypothetical protein ABIE67_005200 [Streptomyces sp. V4I8]